MDTRCTHLHSRPCSFQPVSRHRAASRVSRRNKHRRAVEPGPGSVLSHSSVPLQDLHDQALQVRSASTPEFVPPARGGRACPAREASAAPRTDRSRAPRTPIPPGARTRPSAGQRPAAARSRDRYPSTSAPSPRPPALPRRTSSLDASSSAAAETRGAPAPPPRRLAAGGSSTEPRARSAARSDAAGSASSAFTCRGSRTSSARSQSPIRSVSSSRRSIVSHYGFSAARDPRPAERGAAARCPAAAADDTPSAM